MKTISKRPIKQLKNVHSSKNIRFDLTQTIIYEGHFIKPSTLACFTNQKVQIICKGYGKDASFIANQILKSIRQPMLCLVNQQGGLNKFCKNISQPMSQQAMQRYFILNLIDSCFQQLATKSIQGSCSFDDKLYIAKNKMIQCYTLSQKGHKTQIQFNQIGSKTLPFQLNTVSGNYFIYISYLDSHSIQNATSKQTKGFLACQKNYQNIIVKKYFPEVQFLSISIPKNQNILFLMGNSQCFCHFSKDEVINIFKTEYNLQNAGKHLIQTSKKKWKTIYQQDMTLILSVFT